MEKNTDHWRYGRRHDKRTPKGYLLQPMIEEREDEDFEEMASKWSSELIKTLSNIIRQIC